MVAEEAIEAVKLLTQHFLHPLAVRLIADADGLDAACCEIGTKVHAETLMNPRPVI